MRNRCTRGLVAWHRDNRRLLLFPSSVRGEDEGGNVADSAPPSPTRRVTFIHIIYQTQTYLEYLAAIRDLLPVVMDVTVLM